MRIDVLTIFPGMFESPLRESLLGRAIERGLVDIWLHDIRDVTTDKHRQVDDESYGGGPGMVMKPEPIFAAVESLGHGPKRVLLLSPAGRRLDQALVRELADEPWLVLVCGRYEGVDDRVREHLVTDAVSVGPYVLSGGELAAMVVADAVIRKLPGALGHADSALEESFSKALGGAPEYPHDTRPASYRGWEVPDVLLSGDHSRIREWRLERSREGLGARPGH
jgi:tRNA (guanine37-N1)-methyltransferase